MLNLGQRFEDTRENAKSALSMGGWSPEGKTFGAATAHAIDCPFGTAPRSCKKKMSSERLLWPMADGFWQVLANVG